MVLPIDITLANSIVVDSEWWVQDNSPHPCLISWRTLEGSPTVVSGTTTLPGGYKYYLSWFVGAERNKIPLPDGGQWVCLASLSHTVHFDCITKVESLATAYERICGKSLSKNARDRFVNEALDFTDYSDQLAGNISDSLHQSEIEYSAKDAEVTWEIFEALLPQILKLQPEKFWSIVAHSNMYTYSHPDVKGWIAKQNQIFAQNEQKFETACHELKSMATPETCPNLDWSIMPLKKIPRWRNKKITVKTTDFAYLLGVKDAEGNALKYRPKSEGGWINGNCKLFSKDMISEWEKGTIVASNPGAKGVLDAVISMSFWLGLRSNFADTYRWNTGIKVFQDQTPKAAMTGRSTSKTCLLFPKNISKPKIGFACRMVYHHMPPGVYQVGVDFSAQEALILGLLCKALGDDRLYDRVTSGRIHDENAADWGVSREDAKAGFYAGTYGAGAVRLHHTLGLSLDASRAIVEGLYGRGGILEAYLRYLKRHEYNVRSIFYNRAATVKHTSIHLLKDWTVQSCGNDQLDFVIANMSQEGHTLSQTVHDEMWFLATTDNPEPWLDPKVQHLSDRINHWYFASWGHLCNKLNLPRTVIDRPCFHSETEITNRGLKYYRHTDGLLCHPVEMANPATGRVTQLGRIATELDDHPDKDWF